MLSKTGAYTAASVNLLAMEDGMAVVNSPEETVAESKDAGITYADVDLDRLDYSRKTDEQPTVPNKYFSIPGLIRALARAMSELPLQKMGR